MSQDIQVIVEKRDRELMQIIEKCAEEESIYIHYGKSFNKPRDDYEIQSIDIQFELDDNVLDPQKILFINCDLTKFTIDSFIENLSQVNMYSHHIYRYDCVGNISRITSRADCPIKPDFVIEPGMVLSRKLTFNIPLLKKQREELNNKQFFEILTIFFIIKKENYKELKEKVFYVERLHIILYT